LSLAMPYFAAVAVAYGIGMVAGFALYSRFVFPRSSRRQSAQIGWFVAVNTVGLAQVVALTFLLRGYALPWAGFAGPHADAVAHGMAIGVSAVTSYFGHRSLTFRRPI
jgi:energy-coupling factor transport system substrate-specific component